MSNTRKAALGGVVVPSGDMGIGLCLQCLGEVLAGAEDAGPPRFAITLAPMPQQIPTPAGVIVAVVAVPACWDHLAGAAGPQEQKRPLLVAGGALR